MTKWPFRSLRALLALFIVSALSGCALGGVLSGNDARGYDVIIRNGMIYDGSGNAPYRGDVAIKGDTIAALGSLENAKAKREIDATGLAVAPGFINMLSWANVSLLIDPLGQSDIHQGVTLEVLGEGDSMGPLNDRMKQDMRDYAKKTGLEYDIPWTTLGEYLQYLQDRGVTPNVSSFVGTATVRNHEIGYEDRKATPEELSRMQDLVRGAMKEGALGLSSALIYTPGVFADTDELIALTKAAGEYNGMYISHMRSEANKLLESMDELITIAKEANVPAEIYHFKMGGKANWGKIDAAINKIEQARASGIKITADMYTYTAGGTGLDAAMPPWVQEGGFDAWVKRLQDPAIRAKVAKQMVTPSDDWENWYLAAGNPENILLVGFTSDELRPLTGKTLAEVARERGTSPEETAMDLVVEDGSRIETIFFIMSEDNVRRLTGLPWMSFDSDEASQAPEGVFLTAQPHPRAYGSFARFLGKYVREDKVSTLQDAIRRLTAFPASNLKIQNRGHLEKGYFADVVVFDPDKIIDLATYKDPQQYAVGVDDVFVNGVQVLKDGNATGATPGRFVHGPGWDGREIIASLSGHMQTG